MPKSMVFHQNSNRYSYTKSRHAEGKWMKQHTEIDDFLRTSVHFGWFFGGRRFLVLIIKVTLSELSEASAPSTTKNAKKDLQYICMIKSMHRDFRGPKTKFEIEV